VKEEDERRKKKEKNRAHPVSDNILYCSNKPGTFFVSKFLAVKNGEGRGGGACGTAAAEKRKGFHQREGERVE
jgi:hypothetical protein